MDLDWCSDDNFSNFEKFNENSIIGKNKKKNIVKLDSDDIKNDLNVKNCFLLNLDDSNNENILLIINYLSFISSYLRMTIRNKSSKFNGNKYLELSEYESIIEYLNWLINALDKIKKYFAQPTRRDNSFDPLNIKLFKTSSYKFCNFKESCSIHKNKNSKCDKNHFVFDMVINDIVKLKESLTIVGFDGVNWTLENKLIIATFDSENKNYTFKNIENINTYNLTETQFIIDKTLIFKSFDVISYVLNKMYEEALYFLNNNINTLLISINN